MSIYQENGFKNRKEYLEHLASEYNVDLDIIELTADLLGEDEDFDGLVSLVESQWLRGNDG